MTVEEMKKLACENIEKHAAELAEVAHDIFLHPELGFKEFRTAEIFQKKFDALGIKHTDGVAITGIVAPMEGRDHKARIAVMGELDSVIVAGHPNADPVTHAAHCCGHNNQCTSVLGVAYGLYETGIMKELDGDVVLMEVPSEECVEIEYRKSLIDAGKLSCLGGKQEFIKLGAFDDIDMMFMQHTSQTTLDDKGSEIYMDCGGTLGKGFVVRQVKFIGKESHAANPSQGINALEAAKIALMAIDAQRDTFLEKDQIRIHPIITKGGDLVNVVPADVRIETYVRGTNTAAILAAAERVDRSFQAGADALGAKVQITRLAGYMCPTCDENLRQVIYENGCAILGAEHVNLYGRGASTDASDVGALIPAVHMFIAGAEGTGHGADYFTTDYHMAVVDAAKIMACTCIDLLADGAEKALFIKKNFVPQFTKEEYLAQWIAPNLAK